MTLPYAQIVICTISIPVAVNSYRNSFTAYAQKNIAISIWTTHLKINKLINNVMYICQSCINETGKISILVLLP